MSNERLDLIEKGLKSKNIEEYEIYLVEKNIYKTIFLKNQVDNEREIRDFEYFIRILSQKKDETGIGVIKGNSLDVGQIMISRQADLEHKKELIKDILDIE